MIRSSGRAPLRCAFCHAGAAGAVACPGCGTLVHPACSAEAGTCPTLGCAERLATAVEPKAASGTGALRWLTQLAVIVGVLGFLALMAVAEFKRVLDTAISPGSERVEVKITQEIR